MAYMTLHGHSNEFGSIRTALLGSSSARHGRQVGDCHPAAVAASVTQAKLFRKPWKKKHVRMCIYTLFLGWMVIDIMNRSPKTQI